MRTILIICLLATAALSLDAQPASPTPTATPKADDDPTGIFKLGTVIGKTADEITATTVFGKPNFVRTGKFGLPTAIDYWISMPSQNPYSHEVGFFGDGKTGYIIFTKRALEPAPAINDAEVTGLLLKVGRGGTWQKDATKNQYKGTAYVYTHEVSGQKFNLLAYRSHSKKSLIVYHPNVTPNLDGPGGLGGLAYAFADGQRVVWTQGEGNDMVTAYVDAKSPWPNVATFVASDPSGVNLEAVSQFVRKSAAENKVTLFDKAAFDNFAKVTKYLAVAKEKPLPSTAISELKNVVVWGAPLELKDNKAAVNWLLGAKYELLRQNPTAAGVTGHETPSPEPTPDSNASPR